MYLDYKQNGVKLLLVGVALIGMLSCVMGQNGSNDPGAEPFNNTTPTWEETLSVFQELASMHEKASLIPIGLSDVGRPIHAFILSDKSPEIQSLANLRSQRDGAEEKLGLLVNNAIHPGEPCGVDASIEWVRRLFSNPVELRNLLEIMDVAIIPMYNVGGALNRNCCTRTNQDGPEAYGFRGNARNLDLNRDFIKMDSQNARAFTALFHAFRPQVFIDTHTTNGADYPYAMTLISTQPDKAGPVLGQLIQEVMEPFLFREMSQKNVLMAPYVYSKGETPDDGILGFLETPRYSTGYTALFGCIGFTAEAHMLKPFPVRVAATLALIESVVNCMRENEESILNAHQAEQMRIQTMDAAPVRWELSERTTPLPFSGYKARREVSVITGDLRLKYDRDSIWHDTIPFYNHYDVAHESVVPEAFIISQAWKEVIERLQWNEVEMQRIPRDTTLDLRVAYIEGFSSSPRPYEGHHLNTFDSLRWAIEPIRLYAGDYVIKTAQSRRRYLMETLDPHAHDAFFTWNFFDSAMQQKEHYSAYVFEETAAELLRNDAELKRAFEAARNANPNLAELNWLYKASKHFEGTVNRYPVYQTFE